MTSFNTNLLLPQRKYKEKYSKKKKKKKEETNIQDLYIHFLLLLLRDHDSVWEREGRKKENKK